MIWATSLETLAHMVAGGIGCTLLPALAAGPRGVRGAAGLEIRRFKSPVPHRTIGLVWRRRYPHGDMLHEMARCLRQGLPAVSEKRLSLTPNGNIRYPLKPPDRDGTTHAIFEPMDFIARLAALVPKPRVHLTRCHSAFAPNSKHCAKHRVLVTPAKRGKGDKARVSGEPPTPAERRASMTWAQRLKRVFDIEICRECGGAVKAIADIEDPVVMPKALATLAGQALWKIRDHLKEKGESLDAFRLPESRGLPETRLFDEGKSVPESPESADHTRQGSRSAAGSEGADHGAEIQSMPQVEPPHQLRLTTTGRETAGLARGGWGGFSGIWGVYTSAVKASGVQQQDRIAGARPFENSQFDIADRQPEFPGIRHI